MESKAFCDYFILILCRSFSICFLDIPMVLHQKLEVFLPSKNQRLELSMNIRFSSITDRD